MAVTIQGLTDRINEAPPRGKTLTAVQVAAAFRKICGDVTDRLLTAEDVISDVDADTVVATLFEVAARATANLDRAAAEVARMSPRALERLDREVDEHIADGN